MPSPNQRTLRRSVALPRQLVEEALALAPPELQANLNRLVIVSLRQYLEGRRQWAAEQAMAEMAADPQLQAVCSDIAREFASAESDGLRP